MRLENGIEYLKRLYSYIIINYVKETWPKFIISASTNRGRETQSQRFGNFGGGRILTNKPKGLVWAS